jgi:hypothetical protein
MKNKRLAANKFEATRKKQEVLDGIAAGIREIEEASVRVKSSSLCRIF